jgi:hypothetical protein
LGWAANVSHLLSITVDWLRPYDIGTEKMMKNMLFNHQRGIGDK